jgi:hypothetical protein
VTGKTQGDSCYIPNLLAYAAARIRIWPCPQKISFMPAHKKTVRSYMKPVAKTVTIQKPQQKQTLVPLSTLPDGFTRISDSKIRKVYK